MAAYAYNPQPFSGMNTNPFTQAVAGLTPIQKGFYDIDTNAALQEFINRVRPSNVNEELLRRMLNQIRDQWQVKQYNAPTFGDVSQTSFMDYLKDYDYNRAFARINPQARRESSTTFNRPVRTITF